MYLATAACALMYGVAMKMDYATTARGYVTLVRYYQGDPLQGLSKSRCEANAWYKMSDNVLTINANTSKTLRKAYKQSNLSKAQSCIATT